MTAGVVFFAVLAALIAAWGFVPARRGGRLSNYEE